MNNYMYIIMQFKKFIDKINVRISGHAHTIKFSLETVLMLHVDFWAREAV